MKSWIQAYLQDQVRIAGSLPLSEIEQWIGILKEAREVGRQVFACGNGGSASNSSHFAVDLGKGSSGMVPGAACGDGTSNAKRFRVVSLTDNVAWLTALGNDCSYEDVFAEQLKNYGQRGDVLIGVSVSGDSPNVVKAIEWANGAGMTTLALVGNRPGNRMAQIASRRIAVDSGHYGRAEDAQMHVLHLLCYAFIERQA